MPLFNPLRLVAAVLVLVAGAGLAAAQQAKVTFVLTNDLYQMSEEKGRGGMARLASVVKAEKAKGGTVLFVHAGDTFSPCLLCGFDQGAHMVALLNELPPDVFVPGNHEFDFGKEVYFRRRAEARFPFFAANLRGADGEPLPDHKDRTILDVNGVRIGIVGIALETTPNLSNPGDLQFAPAIETLEVQAKALRDEGADVVVAVTHTGRLTDFQIVEQRLVDVLLTGHDHDLRVFYDGRTVMAESGQDAEYVVAVDLAIEVETRDGKRRAAWRPNFRIVDTTVVMPDPAVAEKVAGYEAALSKLLDEPIATTAVELDARTVSVRTRETGFGDLVADAIRASTGADLAIVNGGGIRANKLYPAGSTLTARDIGAALPFGNKTVVTELKGADVKAALENGLRYLGTPAGRFPQVAGLVVEVDRSRPEGRRIVSATVGSAPLDEAKSYRVATVDFLLRGGDEYAALTRGTAITPTADAKLVVEDVIDHLRRIGRVEPQAGERIVVR
jgi:2',3'-cyclic-nucleotide 2'-phosphodiesterase (5'-nucleotidase family)